MEVKIKSLLFNVYSIDIFVVYPYHVVKRCWFLQCYCNASSIEVRLFRQQLSSCRNQFLLLID